MRIIYDSHDQKAASLLSSFLKSQGIDNQLEVETNSDWGSENYGVTSCRIWVIEEDSLQKALEWRDEFNQNPDDPKFKVNDNRLKLFLEETDEKLKEVPIDFTKLGLKKNSNPEESKIGFITLYILITCIMLFLFSGTVPLDETKLPKNIPLEPVVTAPVNKILLYDYPKSYDLTDQLISNYGLEKLENPSLLPESAVKELQQIQNTPYWNGLYDKIVAYFQTGNFSSNPKEPMFEKIQQGEVWRLITPILMHGSILHLAFNMILFVILGKQMEKKMGAFKFLIFILLTATFSNSVQYLMSGSNFIGISGVITAMIGFVFMRQKYTAWEGYQFTSISLSSVVVFIMLMFFLQILSFLIEISFKLNISPGIANAAHLSGLIFGLILGRTNFFKLKN